MRIVVGSTNPVKVNAVREVLKKYSQYADADIESVKVNSGVPEQPRSMRETIDGAVNRARAAYLSSPGYDLGFGIEDGLMEVPHTETDYMNLTACAIYDGKNTHLGLGPAFEYPAQVTRIAVEEGLDIDEAMVKAGLTNDPDIGSHGGAIGFLTKGRITRTEYIKPAIRMAIIHLENSRLF
jgi:inosine/xanthosine triphosphatase